MKRSIWPDRPLTAMETGMVVVVVALLVLCCLGTVGLGLLAPDPAAPVILPSTGPS